MEKKGMNFINIYQNEYSFEEKINENFKKIDNFFTLSIVKKITSLEQKTEDDVLYLIDNNEDDKISDKINQIACYNANSGWFFYVPKEGDILFLQEENKFYFYANNSWQEMQKKENSNLDNLTDKDKARENLEVYSKNDTYSKEEIDEKIKKIPSSQKSESDIDMSSYMTKNSNLKDIEDMIQARENLEVYSKNEIDSRILKIRAGNVDGFGFLYDYNNLGELKNKSKARENLEVYSKNDTYSKKEIDEKINLERIDTSLFLKSNKNLKDLTDLTLARSNLNVYSTNDTYSKREIDRKFVDVQIKGKIDTSTILFSGNNLEDVENKDKARENLEVCSKNEVLKKNYNLLDLDDKQAACANLNVYNKNETFDRTKNLLDVLDQDAACHNLGTLRDWEIHRVGDYKASAVRTDHDNWLICDGREIKRDEYPELFKLIGIECGEGDGKNTFNLPNFRNKTLWGADGNLNSTLSSGLPNIYGKQNGGVTAGERQEGAIYSQKQSFYYIAVTSSGGLSQCDGIEFNASKYNPIYGNSEIVQPPAICVNIFIKAK